MTVRFNTILILSFFSIFFIGAATSVQEDQHEKCINWANAGECDTNPTYMLSNCATSCDSLEKQKLEDAKEIASIESFFGLKANDIHGKQISFKEFEGKVTLVSV
jgi:hypothetical protein